MTRSSILAGIGLIIGGACAEMGYGWTTAEFWVAMSAMTCVVYACIKTDA